LNGDLKRKIKKKFFLNKDGVVLSLSLS